MPHRRFSHLKFCQLNNKLISPLTVKNKLALVLSAFCTKRFSSCKGLMFVQEMKVPTLEFVKDLLL